VDGYAHVTAVEELVVQAPRRIRRGGH
jgi:hypothetical protein